MGTVNEKNLTDQIDYPDGRRIAQLMVVSAAISHPRDIYGQIIEFLRMNRSIRRSDAADCIQGCVIQKKLEQLCRCLNQGAK